VGGEVGKEYIPGVKRMEVHYIHTIHMKMV
jgi:hypothetical protein